jgi:hypothetical protein
MKINYDGQLITTSLAVTFRGRMLFFTAGGLSMVRTTFKHWADLGIMPNGI